MIISDCKERCKILKIAVCDDNRVDVKILVSAFDGLFSDCRRCE